MAQSESSYSSIKLLSEINVKKYVLPSYNLENFFISQIKLKNTDKQRAVYKIFNNNESYCLKKVFYGPRNLLFIYSAIEWWFRNDINVPRILPTTSGGRFVNYKNMLFILTPWIEGTKCDYDNEIDFLDSGINLAKMHMVSKDFIPITNSSYISNYKIIYNSIYSHVNNLLKCSNAAFNRKDEFSKLYLSHFPKALKLAKISSDSAFTINNNNISKSLCHLDYVNKNMIFDKDRNLWIIDFDNCKMDYCAHDIGYCLRRVMKRTSTNWNLDITLKWLYVYTKINPLTLDDYKYLFSYLSFPQNYWRVSKNYYKNNVTKNQLSVKQLKKSVKNLDSQLDFCLDFKSYIEAKFNTKLY